MKSPSRPLSASTASVKAGRQRPPLIQLIYQEATLRGITVGAAAVRELNVTYGYLYQLTTGTRRLESLSREMVMRCSTFLRLPPMTVMQLAGIVQPTDWAPVDMTERQFLEVNFLRMLEHHEGKSLTGVDFNALPVQVRRWMVGTFASSTGIDLYGRAVKALPAKHVDRRRMHAGRTKPSKTQSASAFSNASRPS